MFLIEKGYTDPKTKKIQDHYDKILHVALLNYSIKVKKKKSKKGVKVYILTLQKEYSRYFCSFVALAVKIKFYVKEKDETA